MPKLLWVALPLLLAAAVLAVQVLRGRAPSRHAINVAASVLLLVLRGGHGRPGHLLGRQPAVAGVRLALPVRLRHGTAGVAAPRLQLPGGVAILCAAKDDGHRRDADSLPGSAARSPARRARRARSDRSHRRSLHAGPAQWSKRTEDRNAARPRLAGWHHGVRSCNAGARTRRALPRLLVALACRRVDARTGRRLGRAACAVQARCRRPQDAPAGTRATHVTPFDLGALADILWHTSGVTETRGGLHLRASPSSGALFSTELYVAALALPGLAPGLWHYDPQSHALARLRNVAAGALLPGAIADDALRDAPALVVATAVFRRTGRKYGDRSYRYVLADLGHALENLRIAAGGLGVGTRFVAAFDESRTAQALGVDEAEEGVLAVVALGAPATAAEPSASTPTRAAATPGEASRWLAASARRVRRSARCDGRRARRDLAARGLCAIAGIGCDASPPPLGAGAHRAAAHSARRAGLVGGDREAPLGASLHENAAAATGAGRRAGAHECTSRPGVVSCRAREPGGA